MVDRFSGAGEDGVAIGGRGIGGSGRGHGGGFGVVMGGGGGWIGWGGITTRSLGGTRSNVHSVTAAVVVGVVFGFEPGCERCIRRARYMLCHSTGWQGTASLLPHGPPLDNTGAVEGALM